MRLEHSDVFVVALTLAAVSLTPLAGAQTRPVEAAFFAAGARVVTFDTGPTGVRLVDRQPLQNVYAPWGVVFGADDLATATDGLATSLPNRALPGMTVSATIDCFFANGVGAVGAHGFDFVLEVFDARGTRLGRVAYSDGTAGLYGGARELRFLGVASTVPIAHARFSRYWDQQLAFGFAIDDLRFLTVQ